MADTPPWYSTLDPDHLTFVQSKGWHTMEPAAAAVELAKAYRGSEKLRGGLAAGDVVQIPRDIDPAETHKAFWQRVGAAPEASGYKFDAVKRADGSSLPDADAEFWRNTAFELQLPVAKAQALVEKLMAYNGTADAQAAQAKAISDQVALQTAQAELKAKWGANEAANKFVAAQAMDTLGVPPEARAALDKGLGYVGVMEHFLALGKMMGEGRFVTGPGGGAGGALSPDEARAQLDALRKDQGWMDRWSRGGVEEQKRHLDLLKIIHGAQ